MSYALYLLLTGLWSFYLNLAAPPLPARTYAQSLGGRDYLVHVPSQLAHPTSLVIALHGAAGTGRQMERLTGFSAIADRAGFIVAYPDGLNRRWNDGRELPGINSDDVGFIGGLIDRAVSTWGVDAARVYVTGFSNGATMANRLACELPDKIAAIAPVSGGIALPVFQTCRPAKPVSYFAINGIADPILPFYGGVISFANSGDRGVVIASDTAHELWAGIDGCTPTEGSVALGATAVQTTHPYCNLGTRVQRIAINGGGHKYPGVDNGFGPVLDQALGPTCGEFNASEAIWSFFDSLPPRLSEAELQAIVTKAFYVYSGQGPGSAESLAYWMRFLVARKMSTVDQLVAFLVAQYLPQPGSAEAIVNNMFMVYQGRPTTADSLKYWADGIRREHWTYVQLLNYFMTTYLPQPGTAETIARTTLEDFSGQAQAAASVQYWADAMRRANWTYRQLMAYFMTTYLPLPGSAESIVTQAFLAFARHPPDAASLKYWSEGIRAANWNFLTLLTYFVATYGH